MSDTRLDLSSNDITKFSESQKEIGQCLQRAQSTIDNLLPYVETLVGMKRIAVEKMDASAILQINRPAGETNMVKILKDNIDRLRNELDKYTKKQTELSGLVKKLSGLTGKVLQENIVSCESSLNKARENIASFKRTIDKFSSSDELAAKKNKMVKEYQLDDPSKLAHFFPNKDGKNGAEAVYTRNNFTEFLLTGNRIENTKQLNELYSLLTHECNLVSKQLESMKSSLTVQTINAIATSSLAKQKELTAFIAKAAEFIVNFEKKLKEIQSASVANNSSILLAKPTSSNNSSNNPSNSTTGVITQKK